MNKTEEDKIRLMIAEELIAGQRREMREMVMIAAISLALAIVLVVVLF